MLFMKFRPDVSAESSSDSEELRTVSESFSATPLLLGETTRERPLEDDTLYVRHGISTVNLKTFQNIVLHDSAPLVRAGPGGYYVEIDGDALKRRRQELGLSVGEIADMISISRRTIYGYEHGMTRASVMVAYNLGCALGIPIARPVKILKEPGSGRRHCVLTMARRILAINRFLLRTLRAIGHVRVTTIKKAPFDFVINTVEEDKTFIGAVADANERDVEKRVDEILSISRVVLAHPLLVTDEPEVVQRDISCLSTRDISRIKSPDELLAYVK